MKTFVLPLSAVLLSPPMAAPVSAAQGGFIVTVSDSRRHQLRDAVDAHRAARRDEVRREEAAAGRRLTAAELAELREQVRGQRLHRAEVIVESAESQPAERIAPASASGIRTLFGPRSQRP
ncbi:MAG: hypothetical protein EOP81_10465 [Variovorax sp.]|nr:MAG: hypothetical protein EOP81_10465 [Variovorax sp.]